MWGHSSTTCSNATEVAKWGAHSCSGELSVAVGHSQLWTMASEMVDPIHWPVAGPHPTQGIAGQKSQHLQQPLRRERTTIEMPVQRTACAATQSSAASYYSFEVAQMNTNDQLC